IQDRGEVGRIDEFLAPDFVNHAAQPGGPAGLESARFAIGATRTAFPDHDAKVIHMVAEGDIVATYKTFTGTNTGNFFGTPPTGKRAIIRVMDFVRYRQGKIAEHWNIVDMAGLMAQLNDG